MDTLIFLLGLCGHVWVYTLTLYPKVNLRKVALVFSGMLLGIAIRTGSPLSLNLAEPMWKQLAGLPLSVSDLTEVDKDCVPGMCIQNQCV